MASLSTGIVKRGYLYDRKGILDRKRWYVLRRDIARGSCLIEIFKDERAAARFESPKAAINVHDIVEVHRVVERKQSFELLCPGLGYRFMANSDVEADEWVASIRALILYRREPPLFSSTLPGHTQPVAISPSAHTLPPHSSLTDTGSLHRSHSYTSPSLPTPPDLPTSPATQLSSRSFNRGNSTELVPLPGPFYSFPPPPSPPSSSSGSSMASGSNVSYEQTVGGTPDMDTDVRFRVQVKESEGLAVSGAVDLVLGDGRLALQAPETGRMLVSWPIAALRRYGVNNVSLTIVTGRNCSTGEGKFQFYTQQSRRVYSHLHAMAVSKAAGKTQPLCRSGSEGGVHPQQSPPASSHTDHSPTLQPPASEDYSRLNWLQGHGPQPRTGEGPHNNCSNSTSTLC